MFKETEEVTAPVTPKVIHVWIAGTKDSLTGVCGWGYRLVIGDEVVKKDAGGVDHSTSSSRMEVMATVKGIEAATQYAAGSIVVHAKNTYICNGGSKWCVKWNKQNWEDVKHPDLWKIIYHFVHKSVMKVGARWVPRNNIRFEHIKAHSEHFTAAHGLARAGRREVSAGGHIARGTTAKT